MDGKLMFPRDNSEPDVQTGMSKKQLFLCLGLGIISGTIVETGTGYVALSSVLSRETVGMNI